MPFPTFVSSYCASCLFAFYFDDVVVKNFRTLMENRIPTTSSLSNFPCFIPPQRAHLFTLISSDVELGWRVRRVTYVTARNTSLCRITSREKRVLFRFPQPRTFLSQSATSVEGLIKLEDLPKRNLDRSRPRAGESKGANNTRDSTGGGEHGK